MALTIQQSAAIFHRTTLWYDNTLDSIYASEHYVLTSVVRAGRQRKLFTGVIYMGIIAVYIASLVISWAVPYSAGNLHPLMKDCSLPIKKITGFRRSKHQKNVHKSQSDLKGRKHSFRKVKFQF